MKRFDGKHANYLWSKAELCCETGDDVESWYALLQYQEYVHRWDRSARQKEVQRLWQQRGLLERTKANLRSILRDGSIKAESNYEARALTTAVDHISELIRRNIYAMHTVKERIPA